LEHVLGCVLVVLRLYVVLGRLFFDGTRPLGRMIRLLGNRAGGRRWRRCRPAPQRLMGIPRFGDLVMPRGRRRRLGYGPRFGLGGRLGFGPGLRVNQWLVLNQWLDPGQRIPPTRPWWLCP